MLGRSSLKFTDDYKSHLWLHVVEIPLNILDLTFKVPYLCGQKDLNRDFFPISLITINWKYISKTLKSLM